MDTSLLIVMILFLAILTPLLRKWIVRGEREKISDTSGKFIEIIGKLVFTFISIFLILIILDTSDENTMKWYFLILIIVAFSFQLFMEWKFLKKSKEFVVTLLLLLLSLFFYFLFIF